MNSELESALPPVKLVGKNSVKYGHPPSARFNRVSERLRKTASKDLQCSIFCAGGRCKYEGSANWCKEDMAIDGVYSHWITSDILAMSRPSTEVIQKFKIIQQFNDNGIKSLINLQQRGEHARCGSPLLESGFTYDPQLFMDSGIFYYNFQWKDYDIVSQATLADMVKVMTFALTEGKLAIHCHTGQGRTGVLIACFLVYTLRCKPNDAIRYVRLKRPLCIQTKSHIECVQQFAQFVVPLFVVFANVIPRSYGFTINQFLKRQRFLLHGEEARLLKYIPKIVYVVCERLLVLHERRKKKFPDSGVEISSCGNDCSELRNTPGYFSASSHKCHWCRLSQWTVELSSENASSKPSLTDSNVTAENQNNITQELTEDNILDSATGVSEVPEVIGDTVLEHLNSLYLGAPTTHRNQILPCNGNYEFDDDFNCDIYDNIIDTMLIDDSSPDDLFGHTGYSVFPPRPESELSTSDAEDEDANDNTVDIAEALLTDHQVLGSDYNSKIRRLQKDLNNRNSAWEELSTETNAILLSGLLWSWLDHLRIPVLSLQDLAIVVIWSKKPRECLLKLDNGTRYTTEYLVRFIARLYPATKELRDELLRRLVASLAQQTLCIRGVQRPVGNQWGKLREGTTAEVMLFVHGLYDLVVKKHLDAKKT